ncbi:hypothetical protein [Prevotella sp. E2-28]|uniref:hypothetical protein n=1 Tax=Prevotella sp. E2-28 TaxID=2913620 RepID=UPI001ED9F644|nr:hypothetical protein [Prevotella sp. E2-28]UKK52688.1 hypothetical protein L6465_08730 [Prevotella sp. E2-28]
MVSLHQRFESRNDIRLLRVAVNEARRTGNLAKALKVSQDIENLWLIFLGENMSKAEKEVGMLDKECASIPASDKDEMMEKLLVVFMCCDIIESAVIDANDALHKTHKDTDITSFDDLKQTLGLARQKLQYLQENGDYMKDQVWANKCDDMYQMMCSKSKSIMRKRKESSNWGENTKKIEEGK